MSLRLDKLQKLVKLEGGMCRARCPACAEAGQDHTGNHLRIYPDGKFGCCVHTGDREHRKRIFALAGERTPQTIRVRVAGKREGAVQTGILGRIQQAIRPPNIPDASDGGSQVKMQSEEVRTPRTGLLNSTGDLFENSRTLRTPSSNPHVYAEIELVKEDNNRDTLKEFGEGVRSVRESKDAERVERMPHLTPGGTLVIPFDSPERYHWWKGGQSVLETIAELKGEKLEREMRKENYGNGV